MNSQYIPFAKPDIGDAEIQEVVDTMRSGWLTTGPKTRRFEFQFAERVGARHAIAVNSGTAAMHLALEAIGVGPGDRVVTTDFTFTATAEVVRYLGGEPVFVDIDTETCNLLVGRVDEALRNDSRIKAVLPVHFGGQACEMTELERICSARGVALVEDAAHAFPATSAGRSIGSIGDATAFSFYVTKTLAVGEGGMLTTDDDMLAERARMMRLHGITRDVFDRYSAREPSWYYEVAGAGYKYNLTDIAAAIGLHQLRRADELRNRREAIANRYLEALADLPVRLPVVRRANDVHAWHLFPIQLEIERLRISRDEFIEVMANRGIGTSVHFIPLHRHPYWRDSCGLQPGQFPNAEEVFQRIVSMPLYSAMRDEEVDRVIDTVRSVLVEYSR